MASILRNIHKRKKKKKNSAAQETRNVFYFFFFFFQDKDTSWCYEIPKLPIFKNIIKKKRKINNKNLHDEIKLNN